MNSKQKNPVKKALIASWIVIGIFLLVWTGIVYIKMNSPAEMGIVGWVIMFGIGLYALALYAGITVIILFIKLLVKIFWKRRRMFQQ